MPKKRFPELNSDERSSRQEEADAFAISLYGEEVLENYRTEYIALLNVLSAYTIPNQPLFTRP